MLNSCSRLYSLTFACVIPPDDAAEYLNILASYMHRTQCVALKEISLPASQDPARVFAEVSRALMLGIGSKLQYIMGMWFEREAMEELTRIISAGMLPNLRLLGVRRFVLSTVTFAVLTSRVIVPNLGYLSLYRGRPPRCSCECSFPPSCG